MEDDLLTRLPYKLSLGLVATQKGLEVHAHEGHGATIIDAWSRYYMESEPTAGWWVRFSWPQASRHLRYISGAWCGVSVYASHTIVCGVTKSDWHFTAKKKNGRLARLAAIMCHDAEAFRVLHWCVTNLGGENA